MFKNFYWQLLLFYWYPMTLETDINISLISFLCSGELINIAEAQEQVKKYYSFHYIFYHQGNITGVNGPIRSIYISTLAEMMFINNYCFHCSP